MRETRSRVQESCSWASACDGRTAASSPSSSSYALIRRCRNAVPASPGAVVEGQLLVCGDGAQRGKVEAASWCSRQRSGCQCCRHSAGCTSRRRQASGARGSCCRYRGRSVRHGKQAKVRVAAAGRVYDGGVQRRCRRSKALLQCCITAGPCGVLAGSYVTAYLTCG